MRERLRLEKWPQPLTAPTVTTAAVLPSAAVDGELQRLGIEEKVE
jgi:hypothetical protein